ncbi:hypothetical protein [Membranihabitans maritimus]|uniref:hypothetical protein n=1 Tax=Membranihabitans maritimus TaxID=2904244 RepID=UPI001F459AD7|nr:hypothetical protein [Membranihabitans maritimus]
MTPAGAGKHAMTFSPLEVARHYLPLTIPESTFFVCEVFNYFIYILPCSSRLLARNKWGQYDRIIYMHGVEAEWVNGV